MISVRNLTKIYKIGKGGKANQVIALNDVSLDFPDKGLVFLLGKSGSGKSTLLNTIGGLDSFDSGEIIIKGKSSKDFKQSDFDSYRNTFIGFIFQEYNILEEFSIGKNLAIALELQGKKATKEEVNKLLEQVDLVGYYKRKPNQLSGGQKQRVAVARALIKNPEIIMADEPTGALDSTTGKQVMETLKKLSKDKLVIIVSHDREFAEIYGDRIVELKDGQIIRDEVKKEVEAVKSSSGVSFIDNKIIHIKKGQKLNQDDMIRINKMIVANTQNTDTIISFDNKSNENVKKTAFITDDGNREIFIQTQKEDISQQTHNPNDLKMIKSKLRFKDSFKMGASSLRHKPIRLFFTILLSVIAFGMFGIVDTMSNFNQASSLYSTATQLNLKTIAISKSESSYNNFAITEKDLNNLQKNNKDYNFYPVAGTNNEYRINELNFSGSNNNSYYTINRPYISGFIAINETIQKDLNLTLAYGRLPQTDDEICISQNMYNTIIKNTSATSFENLSGKTINIGSNTNFKIVGVLKDDTDISKYEDLDGNQNSKNGSSTIYEELTTVMTFGLVNMCYITQTSFDSNIYKFQDINYGEFNYFNLYLKGQTEDNYGGGYSPRFSIDTLNSSSVTYIKSGIDISALTNNQAILDRGLLTDNLGLSQDELIDKINNGLTVSFSYDYKCEKHAFDVEVVGISNRDGGNIYVASDFYKNNIGLTSCIISRFKQSNKDKTLLEYLDKTCENTVGLVLQCQATPILMNFGSIIETLSTVFFWVGLGLAVFAGLMLMNFISTSISYKKREIGVLRAIGARGKDVFSIFFAESFIICCINFILSTIASAIICTVINTNLISGLGISLSILVFGFKQVVLMLAISLFVAFIASFLPVFKFARKNPIDGINNR